MRFILNPFSRRLDAFEADVGPSGDVESITGDSGGAVGPDGSGNISMLGSPDISFAGTPGTNSFAVTDLVKMTAYMVDSTAGAAPYQTIQSAITAAEAAGGGIVYIRPGTYTENLTITGNVQLVGTPSNSDAGTAGNSTTIVGTHIPPASGSLVVSNLRLESATHIFSSAVAGSASIILLNDYIAVTNGYTFNLPNWTGSFVIYNLGSGGTNDGFVNNTGGADCFFISGTIGYGTGNTMVTSGAVTLQEIDLRCPIDFQTGSTIAADFNNFYQTVTCSNNSTGYFSKSFFDTGATAALVMESSAEIDLRDVNINSSNSPAINGSGAGNLDIAGITWLDNYEISSSLTTTYTTQFECAEIWSVRSSLGRGLYHLKTTGTGQTVGATTADLYTLALGSTAASYRFSITITGFSDVGHAVGYTIDGSIKTDGGTATIVDVINRDADEDAGDTAAQGTMLASANNAIVRVTGVAGETYNWRAIIEWVKVE